MTTLLSLSLCLCLSLSLSVRLCLSLSLSVSVSLSQMPSGLAPHAIVAFSVFLQLDGYAELLITHDKKRAKRLLMLAMELTRGVAKGGGRWGDRPHQAPK